MCGWLQVQLQGSVAKSMSATEPHERDLLPGAVSRLDPFIPDRFAQLENLYSELLAQTEARHKAEMEKISAHLAHSEELHKAQVKELTTHLANTEAAHKAQVKELTTHLAKTEKQHKTQIEEISAHLAKTEADHKAQVDELTGRYNHEIEQLRQRVLDMNALLHQRSVNLA